MKEDIKEFYRNHTCQETLEKFNIKTKQKLMKILKELDYDFSVRKSLKHRKSSRSHQSYVLDGQKSSKTQKIKWSNKSKEEKEEWKQIQIKTHNTDEYKDLMSLKTKEFLNNLSEEERELLNNSRSVSMKKWWSSLTEEEKQNEIKKHFDNGAGWNKETIKQTLKNKYNIENISQLNSLKDKIKQSINKTCLEKYGVEWNCQLEQCKTTLNSKSCNTTPNLEFEKLLFENVKEYKGVMCEDKEFYLKNYIYDFKVNNTLIEINPSSTHNVTWNPFNRQIDKYYHKNKSDFAKENNYRCICVWDWDSKEKIIELLLTREKVYARKCEIKSVDKKETIEFLNKHHCQSFAKCSISLGLYYNSELISIMTFDKPRYNKKCDYEIIRYCSIKDVIGGANKLLKHFIDEYKPHSIVSYCDNAKFDGSTYIKLNFKLVNKGVPSRHWYNIKTKEHYTDSLLRQQGFSRLIHHCDASKDNLDTDDNETLMLREGFVEIYDCGQSTYILTIDNI